MFKVALVGHSQGPQTLEVVENVDLDIFHQPGALAKDFFQSEQLTQVLQKRYHLVILWIGSNDIHAASNVLELVNTIKTIIEALERTCGADVRFCLIEPRLTERQRRFSTPQDTYNRVAKAINTRLQNRYLRGRKFISFGVKPFWGDLARDVHFRRE